MKTMVLFATLMCGICVFTAAVDTDLSSAKIQFLAFNFLCWGATAFAFNYSLKNKKK
jgi:hypothetical protein